MANETTGETGAPVDYLSASSILSGTAPTRSEPTTGRTCCLRHLCTAPALADELCAKHIGGVLVDDLTWLDSTTAIVEWRFAHSGFVSTSIVTVEFEGADRSVGINECYWTADGDCPNAVCEDVAESKSLDVADDDERDYDTEREYQDDMRAESL